MKKKYHIVVVGCGGTGSVFMEKLTRYLACRKEKDIGSIVLIDGDVVEEKNLRNQSFIKEDVGLYKSVVWENIANAMLEDHPCHSYGTYIENKDELKKIIKKHSKSLYGTTDITVLIGACDNHACRLVMESFFYDESPDSKNLLYFDSANEFDTGETVFAAKIEGRVISPCRSALFPDVLKGDLRSVREMSCEELNAVAPQHMLINQLAAMQLMMGMVKVLEKAEIPTGVTCFNTNFSTQHFPANPSRKVG